MRRILLIVTLFMFAWSGFSSPQGRTGPNIQLEWTVQQMTDGKANPGFHLYKLTCLRGLCTLYVVTINQCDSAENAAFAPVVEYWENTPDESGDSLLMVSEPRPGVIRLSLRGWDFGDVETKMTLGYVRESSDSLVGKVKSFSGAVIKDSAVLNEVITWTLEPLRSRSGLTRVALDCSYVVLPTLVP